MPATEAIDDPHGTFRTLLRRATEPHRSVDDPDEARRVRLLVSLSLTLAAILTLSAAISALTSTLAPGSAYVLGPRGTAIIAVTAAGFWSSWWRSRSAKHRQGAWCTIVTIDVFLVGFAFEFDTAAAMIPALAMPVLIGTIFLDLRGTGRMAGVSLGLGVVCLKDLTDQPISWVSSFAILIVVLALSLLLSLTRELDLAQIARLRKLEQADAERLRAEAELARTVQVAMQPPALPTAVGVELAAYSEPAREASGDFYDLFLVEQGTEPARGSLVVVVCDVSGKGMASALVMAAARAALRTEATRDPRPGTVLERVNLLLQASIPARMFLTAFVGVLDLASGELRFASGGHPHPYRWVAGEGRIVELESHGLPLGLIEDADYPEAAVLLAPGDLVVAFTDGLVEALDRHREIYGFDRVRDDVEACVHHTSSVADRVAFVVAAMERFVGGADPEDDVTVVGLSIPQPQNRPAGTFVVDGARAPLPAAASRSSEGNLGARG